VTAVIKQFLMAGCQFRKRRSNAIVLVRRDDLLQQAVPTSNFIALLRGTLSFVAQISNRAGLRISKARTRPTRGRLFADARRESIFECRAATRCGTVPTRYSSEVGPPGATMPDVYAARRS
jgi:hypothetical protein